MTVDEKEVCIPEREKEVTEQMKCLDESVANLNQTVERLAPSLNVVLSDGTNKEAGEDKAPLSLCTLASEIRVIRFRVNAMEEGIRTTLGRIEV
jgi:hypothetical protein